MSECCVFVDYAWIYDLNKDCSLSLFNSSKMLVGIQTGYLPIESSKITWNFESKNENRISWAVYIWTLAFEHQQ
jgi:hypothetical protein